MAHMNGNSNRFHGRWLLQRAYQHQGSRASFLVFLVACTVVAKCSAASQATYNTYGSGNVRCWGRSDYGQLNVPRSPGAVRAAASGPGRTCVVNDAGMVHCWGHNDGGEAAVPADLGPCRAVSAGGSGTCVVMASGAVRCWPPVLGGATVAALTGFGPTAGVSVGGGHACAVNTTGSVRCWGDNEKGQASVPPDLGDALMVSAGSYHTCAVTAAQLVRCWGDDASSQCAIPADLGTASAVSAGRDHTCALTASRSVKCWGSGPAGRAAVPGDVGAATAVSAGAAATCVVTALGAARCWGAGTPAGGAGGAGGPGGEGVPSDLGPVLSVSVSLQDGRACAATAAGALRCWQAPGEPPPGNGSGGGDGASGYYGQDEAPGDMGVATGLCTGANHACAVNSRGEVRCWGRNAGEGSPPPGLGRSVAVGCGDGFTCSLSEDGAVSCWGSPDWSGAVAGGSNFSAPAGLGPALSLHVGTGHACVVAAAGAAAVCWGSDGSGQASPPEDLGPVRALSAGAESTCAVTAALVVRCWGDPLVAAVPGDLGEVKAVSAGERRACAVTAAGGQRCWGAGGGAQGQPVAWGAAAAAAVSAARDVYWIMSNGGVMGWGTGTPGDAIGVAGIQVATMVSAARDYACSLLPTGTVADAVRQVVSVPPRTGLVLRSAMCSSSPRAGFMALCEVFKYVNNSEVEGACGDGCTWIAVDREGQTLYAATDCANGAAAIALAPAEACAGQSEGPKLQVVAPLEGLEVHAAPCGGAGGAGPPLGRLPRCTEARLYEGSTQKDPCGDGCDWAAVSFNGRRGYVASGCGGVPHLAGYPAAACLLEWQVVAPGGLSVRGGPCGGPGTAGGLFSELSKCDRFKYIDGSKTSNACGDSCDQIEVWLERRGGIGYATAGCNGTTYAAPYPADACIAECSSPAARFNTYCEHCDEGGNGLACVALGVKCMYTSSSDGTRFLVEPCSSLGGSGGAPGNCNLYVTGPGGRPFIFHSASSWVPDSMCPSGCDDPSISRNRYCVMCGPKNRRRICLAGSDNSQCMTSYVDPQMNLTAPVLTRRCMEMGSTGSKEGRCYATLTVAGYLDVFDPSVGDELSLHPGGGDVDLATAQALHCSEGPLTFVYGDTFGAVAPGQSVTIRPLDNDVIPEGLTARVTGVRATDSDAPVYGAAVTSADGLAVTFTADTGFALTCWQDAVMHFRVEVLDSSGANTSSDATAVVACVKTFPDCASPAAQGNTYCMNCDEDGARLLCVGSSGARCTATLEEGQVDIDLCRSLPNSVYGASPGCPVDVFRPPDNRAFAFLSSTKGAGGAPPASSCPRACANVSGEPPDRYCVMCKTQDRYGDNGPEICLAEGSQACMVGRPDGNLFGAKATLVLQPCSELGAVDGVQGACYTSLTMPGGAQLALHPGGGGVTLAAAQALNCTLAAENGGCASIDCGPHATCTGGTCTCEAGWYGRRCTLRADTSQCLPGTAASPVSRSVARIAFAPWPRLVGGRPVSMPSDGNASCLVILVAPDGIGGVTCNPAVDDCCLSGNVQRMPRVSSVTIANVRAECVADAATRRLVKFTVDFKKVLKPAFNANSSTITIPIGPRSAAAGPRAARGATTLQLCLEFPQGVRDDCNSIRKLCGAAECAMTLQLTPFKKRMADGNKAYAVAHPACCLCGAVDLDVCDRDMQSGCHSHASCAKDEAGARGWSMANRTGMCTCDPGFAYSDTLQACTDIDECSDGKNGGCQRHAVCLNRPGGRECKCEEGFTEVKLADGSALCKDKTNVLLCGGTCHDSAVCTNDTGAFECKCMDGFQGDGVTECQDVDECSAGFAWRCRGGSVVCKNTPGSYECSCQEEGPVTTVAGMQFCESRPYCLWRTCHPHAECVYIHDGGSGNWEGSATCRCKDGYEGDGTLHCNPVRNCRPYGNCHPNAVCKTLNATPKRCECEEGYTGDGVRACTVADPDPCKTILCGPNAVCVSITATRSECACMDGYARSSREECQDVDECAFVFQPSGLPTNGGCHPDAACTNTEGGRNCTCGPGFTGDGVTTCRPGSGYSGSSCGVNNGGCHRNAKCTPVPEGPGGPGAGQGRAGAGAGGGVSCMCLPGYEGDGRTCTDVDECSANGTSLCHPLAYCHNTDGGYECLCTPGDDPSEAPCKAVCWASFGDGSYGQDALPGDLGPVVRLATCTSCYGPTDYTCAVTAGGAARCFGRLRMVNSGQLDPPASPPLPPVFDVSPGQGHTCVLTTAKSVRCFAFGSYEKVPPELEAGGSAVEVAAGDGAACAVTAAGAVSCWTSPGGESAPGLAPDDLQMNGSVVAIASGGDEWCVVTASKTARCFGAWDIQPPSQLADVASVVMSRSGACALTAQKRLECWGRGGAGARALRPPPDGVQGHVASVSINVGYGMAVTSDGAVTVWGDPRQAEGYRWTGLSALRNVAQVAAGSGYACVIVGGLNH